MRNSFSPLEPIRKKRDFKRVFGRGKYAGCQFFVVCFSENDFGGMRLGLSVSKKVGCAVRRNKIKRLVRESCRLMAGSGRLNRQSPVDIVVTARAPVGNLPLEGAFSQVNKSVTGLFARLGLVSEADRQEV